MEKITINDIITFVMKAMDKSMKVRRHREGWFCVYDDNNNIIFEFFISYFDNSKISIGTKRGWFEIDSLSDKDIARLNVLCEEVKEYESEEACSCFKNFFAEDENKITDINELNEDD